MNHNTLVSVIIPTYNRAQSVCNAVDSALEQTYSPVEVIVVDDGSTDDTLSKLRPYSERIRVLRQQNSGPSAARHAGFQTSHGELLAFLDSDDLWRPAFLERCTSLLQRAGDSAPCCISNALLKRVRGRINTSFENAMLFPKHPDGLWCNAPEVLVTRFVQTCQTTVIRRNAYEKAGGFDPDLRWDEHHDLALRLSLLGPWAFTAEALVVWRQSADSISRAAIADDMPFKICQLRVRERFAQLVEPQGGKLLRQVRRESSRIRAAIESRTKTGQTTPQGLTLLDSSFRILTRAAGAAYRRSPWYPKMKTVRLGAGLTPPPGLEVLSGREA